MIVTALVNTTYKRKVVLAGEHVDMDDATAKKMISEKLVRKGGANKEAEEGGKEGGAQ